MIVPAVVGTLVALGAAGRWYHRMLAGALRDRFERGPDGVIRGAEPIRSDGSNGAGILLIHGGGDTPQTMRNLADAFADRGYSVSVPLLPGHGRDLDAFDDVTADAWYEAAERAFVDLERTCSWVGVVGLSMGGAIASRLAADTGRVGAMVLASPYLSMPPLADLVARSAAAWGVFLPAIKTESNESVLDPQARVGSLGYGAFTPRSLRALQVTAARGFASLPRVAIPTLVVQSTTDNRVSTAATRRAFERLGAAEKRLEWIEGAGHVITVDYGWQHVAKVMTDWMETHRLETPAGRRPGVPHASRRATQS